LKTPNDNGTIDDDLAGYFTPEEWSTANKDTLTWDEVRQAFARIAGSLSEAVTVEREER
jgi:hypothetical protein